MDRMDDLTTLRVIKLRQRELEARAEKERNARGLENSTYQRIRAFFNRETQR